MCKPVFPTVVLFVLYSPLHTSAAIHSIPFEKVYSRFVVNLIAYRVLAPISITVTSLKTVFQS